MWSIRARGGSSAEHVQRVTEYLIEQGFAIENVWDVEAGQLELEAYVEELRGGADKLLYRDTRMIERMQEAGIITLGAFTRLSLEGYFATVGRIKSRSRNVIFQLMIRYELSFTDVNPQKFVGKDIQEGELSPALLHSLAMNGITTWNTLPYISVETLLEQIPLLNHQAELDKLRAALRERGLSLKGE